MLGPQKDLRASLIRLLRTLRVVLLRPALPEKKSLNESQDILSNPFHVDKKVSLRNW